MMSTPFTEIHTPFAEYGMNYLSPVRIYRIGKPVQGKMQVINIEVSLAVLNNGGLCGS